MKIRKHIVKKCITILSTSILLIALISGVTCFGATKSGNSYKIFSATVPELAIYINWGVNFQISGTYTGSSGSYKLTRLNTFGYIDPKRVDQVGNGSIFGSVKETIDHAATSTNRNLNTSFWSQSTGIWPTSAYVYFNKQGNPGKSFKYQAKESGNYTFTYVDGVVHNPNHSFTVNITP